MACGRQPNCGSQGVVVDPATGSIPSDIAFIISIISGIAGAVKFLSDAATYTLLGLTAPVAVWLGAVAGALITEFIVFDFWRNRCLTSPDTLRACTSGVIERIVLSFSSTAEDLFPFAAMHDRVDVVVRCDYWFRVENNAAFVHCNSDTDSSPILRGYYKDGEVCGAGLGATIGGLLGAAAGIFLGVLAGAAIASLACGPFAWLCLIIAVIVAALIAAACVLVGAFLGGQAGKWIAEEDDPTTTDGATLFVGDYVSSTGGLLTSGDDDGARVYWFVEETAFHGRSTGAPPFSHTDPDAALFDPITGASLDTCSPPAPPIK